MDPVDHYRLHGLHEGRYPRRFVAMSLEKKLWGGFSKLSLTDLKDITCAEAAPTEEIAYASWALARWYAAHNSWQNALFYIKNISNPPPSFLPLTGIKLLLLQSLYENQRHIELTEQLGEQANTHFDNHSFCLAAAHFTSTIAGQKVCDDTKKLSWINKIYISRGLAPIIKSLKGGPISIDNICAKTNRLKANGRPLISVLIPSFNAEEFIETAIKSVQSQTWGILEIIVVDDASEDKTASIVRELAAGDKRIVLLRNTKTMGAYASRNLALSIAKGALITNHDSDDWSHPQRLELMADSLLNDHESVAAIADWARATSDLYFQAPRIENSLIQASVSTLMFKRNAADLAGYWDSVKVAADSEFLQRLEYIFGKHSIKHVLPGTPLVFARITPTSLTAAKSTHAHTEFFGMRQHYRKLYDAWHRNNVRIEEFYMDTNSVRAFPCSSTNLFNKLTPEFDVVLMGDFSEKHTDAEDTKRLIDHLISVGQHVAIFHWPDYGLDELSDVSDLYVDMAVGRAITLLTSGDHIKTNINVVLGNQYLKHRMDSLPRIRFAVSMVKRPTAALHLLDKQYFLSRDLITLRSSGLVLEDWYIQSNHDVRATNQDPTAHYLTHGIYEGREPNPSFNSNSYRMSSMAASASSWPPLMHYLKIGKALGYNANHPVLAGALEKLPNSPTILLTCHAAGLQLFGAERCLLDVLESLKALRVNAVVTVPSTLNSDYIQRLRTLSIEVFPITLSSWHSSKLPDSWAITRFQEIIKQHDVDFLIANTITLREPLIATENMGIPSAIYAHESPAHDDALCKEIGLNAEAIIAEIGSLTKHLFVTSRYSAQTFSGILPCSIINNIVNVSDFDISKNTNLDHINFALISSNTEKKGVLDVIEIAKLVRHSAPQAKFLLIGPETALIHNLKREQDVGNIPSSVVFMPYTENALAAISQADVILNLSHCQETFGRTVLEGMAARRPVIGYNWGGVPELISDNVTGFLTQPLDLQAVAEKVKMFCDFPDLIIRMGEAGRTRAANLYSAEVMVHQLRDALVDISLLRSEPAHGASSSILSTPKPQNKRGRKRK